ncbi:hypothetical protein Ae201684P_019749 [Aphanomyces euteiches]|uniref:Uncharacterized protein n=1 Tax=Aphanomyces euteiches TaxID=100861 RepID=A0A6G0XED4_9STRA|nr:hypothetical protein Ae201684_005660 [Aphanomyces euteiches]KAH9078672.1 hypothetical protein Ae201684P_019749 [Aphanomyces euteiches]KAH9141651.1 hypothetical protein AeRB84_014189 [Aphanomyces euteiches]KAH9142394.1 hypothetical protein AeRB84_013528 [Aphanomyces euteiches]
MSKHATTCFFNDCESPVMPGSWKCLFHRRRSRCLVVDCANQVYARSLCVRHGGRRQCQHENCTMNQRVGNFCSRHAMAGLKRLCTEIGCTKQAHAKGKCVRHGGGRICKAPDCHMHARHGAFCSRHIPLHLLGSLAMPLSTKRLNQSELNSQLPMLPREVVNIYGQVQPEVWTSNERDLLIEHLHYIDFDNRVEPKASKGQFHEWPFDIPTIEPVMKYDLLGPNFELVEDSRL